MGDGAWIWMRPLLDTLPHLLERVGVSARGHLIVSVPVHPDAECGVVAEILGHLARGRLDGFRVVVSLQRVMAAGRILHVGKKAVGHNGPVRECPRFEITAMCRNENELTGLPVPGSTQLPR